MKLFIIWYQILQDNASEECDVMFLQLVPGLGKTVFQDSIASRSASSTEGEYS